MEQVSKANLQLFFFLLAAAILLTFDRLGILGQVKKAVGVPLEYAQIPVFLAKREVELRFEFFQKLNQIEQENQILVQKLAQITAKNSQLQNLELENRALKTQLQAFGPGQKSLPAKVLGLSRSLVILPEDLTPLKSGLTVTLGNNYIGQILEVGSKLVKVKLPQDSASSIPAVVLTPQGVVRGNLVGRFGTGMILEKVETQEIVPVESIVQTAGDEKTLPGLVLGKIAKVEKAPPNPFLNIEVESLVDFSTLTTVFIVGY